MRSVVNIRTAVRWNTLTAPLLGTRREGSGIVIREDGLILTVDHLVLEAEEIWLTSQNGRVVRGEFLGHDPVTGLALLRTEAPLDLPALKLGDSMSAGIGDVGVLIDGTGNRSEVAIVARQEFAGDWEYLLDEALFVAPAAFACAGAALASANGALIGIGSVLMQQGKQSNAVIMVVPIDLAPPFLGDFARTGCVQAPARPWLGTVAVENESAVMIVSVIAGGPAAKAGLRPRDIVTDIRDKEVRSLADFYRNVWSSGPAGVEVPMRVLRDGLGVWLRVKSADHGTFLRKPASR